MARRHPQGDASGEHNARCRRPRRAESRRDAQASTFCFPPWARGDYGSPAAGAVPKIRIWPARRTGWPGGVNMEEVATVQMEVKEIWASDRRKATMAARLMACCLGIQAEPGFDLNGLEEGTSSRRTPYAMGDCVFKDAWDVSTGEECGRLELLLVDEKGNILAKSKETHALGHALDLLERLPLRASPHAEEWLRNALGEPGPAAARPEPAPARTELAELFRKKK